MWRSILADYPNLQLVDHLEFGWPLDYVFNTPPKSTLRNHANALNIKEHVASFVEKECEFGAMLGPFIQSPFQCSPLMTRSKKKSVSTHIILDLSFPVGASINVGISSGYYQGLPFSFTLPSVTTLSDCLVKLGSQSFLLVVC